MLSFNRAVLISFPSKNKHILEKNNTQEKKNLTNRVLDDGHHIREISVIRNRKRITLQKTDVFFKSHIIIYLYFFLNLGFVKYLNPKFQQHYRISIKVFI